MPSLSAVDLQTQTSPFVSFQQYEQYAAGPTRPEKTNIVETAGQGRNIEMSELKILQNHELTIVAAKIHKDHGD